MQFKGMWMELASNKQPFFISERHARHFSHPITIKFLPDIINREFPATGGRMARKVYMSWHILQKT